MARLDDALPAATADLRQLTIDLMGGYLDPADQWVRLASSMDYSRDRGEQKLLPETGTRMEASDFACISDTVLTRLRLRTTEHTVIGVSRGLVTVDRPVNLFKAGRGGPPYRRVCRCLENCLRTSSSAAMQSSQLRTACLLKNWFGMKFVLFVTSQQQQ